MLAGRELSLLPYLNVPRLAGLNIRDNFPKEQSRAQPHNRSKTCTNRILFSLSLSFFYSFSSYSYLMLRSALPNSMPRGSSLPCMNVSSICLTHRARSAMTCLHSPVSSYISVRSSPPLYCTFYCEPRTYTLNKLLLLNIYCKSAVVDIVIFFLTQWDS